MAVSSGRACIASSSATSRPSLTSVRRARFSRTSTRSSSHTKTASSVPPISSPWFVKRSARPMAVADRASWRLRLRSWSDARFIWCSRRASRVVTAASLSLSVCWGWWSLPDWQWRLVNRRIHYEFPLVRQISTDELAAWMQDRWRKQQQLLDVRTAPEFDVSHLPGAKRIEPGAGIGATEMAQHKVAKDRPILTCCSVGYRLPAFAQKLQHAGFTDVRNLQGSI